MPARSSRRPNINRSPPTLRTVPFSFAGIPTMLEVVTVNEVGFDVMATADLTSTSRFRGRTDHKSDSNM